MVGSLVTSSGILNNSRYDWALFDMDSFYPRDGNEILLSDGNDENDNRLYPRNVATQMTDGEAVVVTGRGAAVKGRMLRTPLFIRMRGTNAFQKVWPISLEATLGELSVY
jgi:hypothetical protein